MPLATCPACKESGRIPDSFIGIKIKCKKCGNSFLVTAPGAPSPAARTAAPAATTPAVAAKEAPAAPAEGIAVEGLDDHEWNSAEAVATPGEAHHHDEHIFAAHADHPEGTKQYKLLTRKDKWFEGKKFDLERLEEAINVYARQGWTVRAMCTPHVAGYSGTASEELVVLLERG